MARNLIKSKTLLIILLFFITEGVAQKLTFSKHIAPILQKNCVSCHREGTAAPFTLLSYEDVVKRAKMIQFVTEKRYMPPWKADPTYSSFSNEKVLTDKEILLIKEWVNQGMPKGKDIRLDKTFSSSATSRKPDAVLKMQKEYLLKGDGSENFMLFVIPFEFKEEMNVESIEYISTHQKVIHHANFGIYEVDDKSINIYGDSIPINANDIMRHATRYAELTKKLIYYNGWVPGATPIAFPKTVGFKMPRRGVIVLTNHYSPISRDIRELSSLNFFFSKTAITRTIETLNIGSGGIGKIEPKLMLWPNEISKFKIQMEIVEPFSLLYIWPHMHLLGKSFKAYYVMNRNDTIPLVRINEWDFNWQEAYKFKKLTKLPKGAVLTIEGTYDNTSKNPNNPNSPPQIVFSDGFMGTKSEMLSLIFVYLSYMDGDENLEL